MAQTGYTPISIYYSSTATNVPTAGNLVAGELAINTADGVLYYKDSSGVVQSIASKAGNSGSFTNLAYTGTLTGGTGVVNLGSGQFYKDASGNVGIGTASPAYKLDVVKTSATTIAVRSGDTAYVSIAGNNNTPLTTSFDLIQDSANAYVYNRANTPMIFATNNTERMRIDSSGNLLVGTTTATGIGGVTITPTYAFFNNSSTSLTVAYFQYNNSTVGSISRTTTTTSYNITSDYRLKENVAPMTGALETVSKLKPVTYKWKSNGSDGQGFIAHELQAVVPDCVTVSYTHLTLPTKRIV